ncbi:GYD domain-containing protein [Aquifex aeolicus]|uniref:GYD domain-containing protein n=1 Tax=Aquifex aeolicus TaxID=63363 RepID=UPI0002DB1CB8|nr:GYD domain-containing protein [Aquifex aeolicus]
MPMYVMLTKLSPYAVKDPKKLKEIEQKVKKLIEENCPGVKWVMNLVVFGPYDYLDVFEAKDDEEASKVALIIRSFGHATTETWSAMHWKDFKEVIDKLKGVPVA